MTSPVGNGLLTGQSLAVGTGPYLTAEHAALDLGTHTEARNATAYSGLKKGTGPYAAMVAWVTGHSEDVTALHVIHGEADANAGASAATYQGYLEEWHSDYLTDLKAITGQVGDFPMLVCQTHSWDAYGLSGPTTGLGQLQAAIDNADIYMVGPHYQLDGAGDGVHLSATGYADLATLHARALSSVLDTGDWEPLRPTGATLGGSVITVDFTVPTGNLQFDTSTVAAQTNQGFSVVSDSGDETIADVSLGVDGTSVEITVSGTPGANPKVRYGWAADGFGNLCDSETDDGLANWCVHFEQAVT